MTTKKLSVYASFDTLRPILEDRYLSICGGEIQAADIYQPARIEGDDQIYLVHFQGDEHTFVDEKDYRLFFNDEYAGDYEESIYEFIDQAGGTWVNIMEWQNDKWVPLLDKFLIEIIYK